MNPDSLNLALGICGGLIALSLSAVGSALGAGSAAQAAIGAWKRNYAQGKQASFMLLTFVGAPLSQTIYGMILMNSMIAKAHEGMPYPALLGIGAFAGLAIGVSAWLQGKAAAAASDAVGETEKGLTNDLAALGIVEVVAIFIMVLASLALKKFAVG
ncbi:MAG: V-type ATP synthase subunit K [Kiritimatiellaeota bacterium]|nr:V-type ATP synthase subunit K [Kiritimatiellota bacterium]